MSGGPASGRIVLVGTPLGNLGDLAPRASEVLGAADRIACEDTRRTGRLLEHLGITAPRLVRMDAHTEREMTPRLLRAAAGGELVAVVTDAGMPALSDPGAHLVRAAAEAGVDLEVVPGPFAGAVAAALSGLLDAAGRFCFEGFLPRRGAERVERLAELRTQRRAVVIFESPHRVESTLADLLEQCGATRRVALCRELTKMHEETWRGSLADAVLRVQAVAPKGEFVIVLEGAPAPAEATDEEILAALQERLEAGDSRRDACAAVAVDLSAAPNRVKRLAND